MGRRGSPRLLRAALAALPAVAWACTPAPPAPGSAPSPGSQPWHEMETLLARECARDEGGPHRSETCRRLRADFKRGKVVFRDAATVRKSWAYGWLAYADLGGGAWGGAVFHEYEGRWLVSGFDGHDPAVTRPVCASPEWRSMQDALAAACAKEGRERTGELCERLSEGFARCSVDFRDAFDVRSSWGVGFAALAPLESVTWGAAVFRKVGGKWVVAGFDGGEIH